MYKYVEIAKTEMKFAWNFCVNLYLIPYIRIINGALSRAAMLLTKKTSLFSEQDRSDFVRFPRKKRHGFVQAVEISDIRRMAKNM